jgi:hypothetical protein
MSPTAPAARRAGARRLCDEHVPERHSPTVNPPYKHGATKKLVFCIQPREPRANELTDGVEPGS